MKNRQRRTSPGGKKSYQLLFIILALFLGALSSCNFPGLYDPVPEGNEPQDNDEQVVPYPVEPGDPVAGVVGAFPEDEQPAGTPPAQGAGTTGEEGDGTLKPVGFVNYGTFNATVRAWTYVPLDGTEQKPPPAASTVSTASTSPGLWPNPSRFISVPMGTYAWCIDWEEGDLNEDGKIDYFHYFEEGPTLLDHNDSDDLDMAEEVAISAPPVIAPVYEGKCGEPQLENACAGQDMETRVYSSPGWLISSEYQPEVIADANAQDFPPPEGITVKNGGGSPFQRAVILTAAGQYIEATTSDNYTAMGVQPHGESIIGWARVLFDGVEIWRGDTSSYWHDAERYMHAVYIEVRCFPPGTHTIRIEALGLEGSGGGMIVPVAYFGFRQ